MLAFLLPMLLALQAAIAHGLLDHRALIGAAALIGTLAPAMSVFGQSGTIYDAPPAYPRVFTVGSPDLNLPLGGNFQAAHIWVNNKSNQFLYLPDAPDIVGPGITRVVAIVASDVARASWTVPAQFAVAQPNNPQGAAILIWLNAGVDVTPTPGIAETPTVSSPQVALGPIAVPANGNKTSTFNVPTGTHSIGILVQAGSLTTLQVTGVQSGGPYLSLPPPGVSNASLQGPFVAAFFSAVDSSVNVFAAAAGSGASVQVVAIMSAQAQFVFNNISESAAVALVGGAGTSLGDTTAPALAPDTITESITTSGTITDVAAAMASFKAAASQVIARVGSLGALVKGTATSVSPAFGQATSAGNLLVAWVTGDPSGVNEITTAAGGWVRVGVETLQPCRIFYKPNCGAAEAAPTFTVATSAGGLMHAQLAEFSGVATATPLDQSKAQEAGSLGAPVAVFALAAADAAFGNLVVCAFRWFFSAAATATFGDTFNNNAVAVEAATTGAVSASQQSNNSYTIMPPIAVASPLGVAPWPYDGAGASTPGQGTVASATLAANPTKAWICHAYSGELNQNGAVADVAQPLQLFNGAAVLAGHRLSVSAGAGNVATKDRVGLAYRGTLNTAMTIAFGGAGAGSFEGVSIGAYAR